MSFLNNKTILLKLDKLTYNRWEEVTWVIEFDFWEESIKADKITIWLNRKIISKNINTSDWMHYSSNTQYNYLFENSLLANWEYKKETIPFNFIIPQNAIVDHELSFDKLLNKIPSFLRTIIEILINILNPNMKNRYSFDVIARIDIPWAVDITQEVQINVL